MNTEDDGRRLRILIYGADTKGIAIPEGGKIPTKRGIAEFAGLHDAQPFQSYDGVVFFHPTFERFEAFMGSGGPAVRRVADQLELDHRGNQVDILFESGGFACALVAESLIAPARCRDDLAPRLVDRLGLLLIAISKRMEPVRSLTDELRPFLSRFAWHEGWFFVPTEARHPRPLADLRREDSMTSFVADERLFVLQALTPKQSETIDYFTSLIDGIVDLRLRLVTELPDWASAFRFEPELALQTRRAELEREGSEIQGQLEGFTAMMRVLSATSDPLVDAVMAVFARTPLKARRVEQFREDLTLVNSSDESIAVVEVKGVNGGITRDHVHQADSHRERSGYEPDFPALLVVNTAMKKAKSIEDKHVRVANEQVQHAAKNNVLILRTLDLLNLVNLLLSGKLDEARYVKLLTESSGWLEVSATDWTIRNGEGA